MLKRSTIGLLLVLAVLSGAAGCSREAKVIPSSKMEKIYREMFLADEWIKANPEKRPSADTSWFYKPIFEKYGYTYEDYLKTVDHQLNDPRRFSELVGRVAKGLETEAAAMNKSVARRNVLRHRADSIAEIIRSGVLKDYFLYENLFLIVSRTDTVDMVRNADGVYYPKPVIADTMYKGPGMVFADTTSAFADSLIFNRTESKDEEKAVVEKPVEQRNLQRNRVVPVPGRRFPSVEKTRMEVVEDEAGRITFDQSERDSTGRVRKQLPQENRRRQPPKKTIK
ncbi:MAG: DUF4296 domain-containing protein [Candidatus Cryptobacteroides sp.]